MGVKEGLKKFSAVIFLIIVTAVFLFATHQEDQKEEVLKEQLENLGFKIEANDNNMRFVVFEKTTGDVIAVYIDGVVLSYLRNAEIYDIFERKQDWLIVNEEKYGFYEDIYDSLIAMKKKSVIELVIWFVAVVVGYPIIDVFITNKREESGVIK